MIKLFKKNPMKPITFIKKLKLNQIKVDIKK